MRAENRGATESRFLCVPKQRTPHDSYETVQRKAVQVLPQLTAIWTLLRGFIKWVVFCRCFTWLLLKKKYMIKQMCFVPSSCSIGAGGPTKGGHFKAGEGGR